MTVNAPAAPSARPPSRPRHRVRRRERASALLAAVRTPRGAIGLGMAAFVVLAAVIGPLVAPNPADALVTLAFGKPSGQFWLGGDYLGRDVLSRVLDGGWVLLVMGVCATAIGVAGGALAGISAAYLRGVSDGIIMRTADVILSFPQVVFPATRPERLPVAGGPAARADTPVLSVQGVAARYGSTPLLAGIGLEVPPRTCVAVVGESGSGKTTLARCVAGLHSNWTGEITFQGTPLARGGRQRDKDVLRRVQYIFQNPYTSLNPRKTVSQIIDQQLQQLTGLSRRDRSARTAEVLEDVSLAPDVLACYPDQLSGGERQRVAIARSR